MGGPKAVHGNNTGRYGGERKADGRAPEPNAAPGPNLECETPERGPDAAHPGLAASPTAPVTAGCGVWDGTRRRDGTAATRVAPGLAAGHRF
ncbi:hypothetical protein GCM10026982_38210 [Nocardiopsis aegyptia]